jgi:GT2 family glycosyltransferase
VCRSQGRILAVIVLYKMAPLASVSFQTLQASAQNCQDPSLVRIFFYDNTPGGQPQVEIPAGTTYESRGENNGLAIAYNRALAIAIEEGHDWLLTLDQDTSLPIDFVTKLAAATAYVLPLAQVGAVVPQIRDGQRLISPAGLRLSLFPRFYPDDYVGVALERTASAINSASTLRVSALEAIGGYDSRFWLDYSDAVLFQRLQKSGYRIFIAGNIHVEHELSVLNMKARVSLERYEDILGAESAYWDEYMGAVALPALALRFAYRIFYKFGRTGGTYPYFRITFRFALRRLFCSRRRRMELWQESVQRKMAASESQSPREAVEKTDEAVC